MTLLPNRAKTAKAIVAPLAILIRLNLVFEWNTNAATTQNHHYLACFITESELFKSSNVLSSTKQKRGERFYSGSFED